ncbi:MAG TPA: hypothetical protein VM779_03385 [Thermoanaerobaculia bacterium]|nr:hypothetical protein [Thermoanaerobaculia bacterium]
MARAPAVTFSQAVAVLDAARRHRHRVLSGSLPFWFALEQQMLRLDRRAPDH